MPKSVHRQNNGEKAKVKNIDEPRRVRVPRGCYGSRSTV
jgi:hypothetical protein